MTRFYKYKLAFVLCFAVFTCFSQNRIIDSLSTLLNKNSKDTNYVKLLLALSEEFYLFKPDTVIPISIQTINIIDKNLATADEKSKHAYLIAKAAAVNNIGVMHYFKGDIPLALEYYNKSLKVSEETGDKKSIAHAIFSIAAIFDSQDSITKAIEYYNRSLKIQEEIDDKNGIASSLNCLGLIYKNQGNIPKALNYYDKALKLREQTGDRSGIAMALNYLANIYREQKDHAKALAYFERSLKMDMEIGSLLNAATTLNNIGLIHQEKGNYNKALEYYFKGLEMTKKVGQPKNEAYFLLNIGLVYNEVGDHEKALEYCEKSLKIRETISDKRGITSSLMGMGSVYLAQKKYQLASSYASRALLIAKELGFPIEIRNAEYVLYQSSAAKGDFVNAFEQYKQYIIYRDSVSNVNTRKASIKNQLKYEFEKKEAVIKEQQEKERVIAEEKDRFQKIVIWSVAVGLLLVIIFAAFVFRSLKITRQQKIVIEEKQKEILDSIRYAKRIQTSLLPTEKYIGNVLNSKTK